ncbi:hypothetical protein GE278_23190 (plasmid) [Enterobacteriaceae bacterium Kacie_13]|nr:hypothetical protein GE278_23190 [Enterobacteriaceae bacterium Kacie_13]
MSRSPLPNRLLTETLSSKRPRLRLELNQYPFEKRIKISVANYILDRSNLARSGVMKILAALRVGEFVDIQRGKLISVLKKFPSD